MLVLRKGSHIAPRDKTWLQCDL